MTTEKTIQIIKKTYVMEFNGSVLSPTYTLWINGKAATMYPSLELARLRVGDIVSDNPGMVVLPEEL